MASPVSLERARATSAPPPCQSLVTHGPEELLLAAGRRPAPHLGPTRLGHLHAIQTTSLSAIEPHPPPPPAPQPPTRSISSLRALRRLYSRADRCSWEVSQ
jgi:hypothetical protein